MNKVPENPSKNRNGNTALLVISGFLITLYITANLMAVKPITVFGLTLFDAGTITFPLAYMLGDVLTELWGYKTSQKVILLSFVCNLTVVLCTALGLLLPAPDAAAETAQAYAIIFAYVPRIVAASLVGFLGGELTNAWVMDRLREITAGKHLWLRTIGSSMVGYIFDTVLFVLLAFGGTLPVQDLGTMILAQYLIKVVLEVLFGTPLAYGLIVWLKKHCISQKEEEVPQ